MEEQTLRELKQIKIQDQIRDLKEEINSIKRRRGYSIAYILQFFLLFLGFTFVSDMPFFLSIWVGFFVESEPWEAGYSPPHYWYWTLGFCILITGIFSWRAISLSKKIKKINLAIEKRRRALGKLTA